MNALIITPFRKSVHDWFSFLPEFAFVYDICYVGYPRLSNLIYFLRAISRILLEKHDVIITVGAINGLFVSAFLRLFFKKTMRHVIIDIGVTAALAGRFRKGITFVLLRFGQNNIASIICFAKNECYFWETVGFGGKTTFMYLGSELVKDNLTLPDRSFASCTDYIFSGGQTGRDFATLVEAVMDLNMEVRIVARRDLLTRRTGLEGIKLPKNVTVIPDMPLPEFRRQLSNALFIVLPLLDVPYPTGQSVLVDAMALGKLVVATRVVGTIDYIIDRETGIFVQPSDANDLRTKIVYLISNPSERNRISENAKQFATKFLSYKNMCEKLAATISHLAIT